MNDSTVEKVFLYLLGFSLLLHVAVFAIFAYLPQEKPKIQQEPYMVDLREMPELPVPPPTKEPPKRLSDRRQRVEKEIMRKGPDLQDRPKPPQTRPSPPQPPVSGAPNQVSRTPAAPQAPSRPSPRQEPGDIPDQTPGQDFFKPNRKRTEVARLYPSARSMSQLEQSYRKRFEADIAEGDTNFLNTDDIQFGSFLRRFETAVYGAWRYPEEAARLGVEGITPVRITFNRNGQIENIQLLESSGSRILDDEVLRTLRSLGPIGSFPRNYTKEQFHLIAFFQYNITRGGMTGRLH